MAVKKVERDRVIKSDLNTQNYEGIHIRHCSGCTLTLTIQTLVLCKSVNYLHTYINGK